MTNNMREAYLGGGCFWCTEAIFQQIKGVNEVLPGYAGGHLANPKYEDLHNQDTGHAEVIKVAFDPSVISYRELLEIFFATHNPTTPNRQGADVGSQYRSIILYETGEQQRVAETVVSEVAPTLWDAPIVTELQPLDHFWPAEDYHHNYFLNNPTKGYCLAVINPKVAQFRRQFADRLKR